MSGDSFAPKSSERHGRVKVDYADDGADAFEFMSREQAGTVVACSWLRAERKLGTPERVARRELSTEQPSNAAVTPKVKAALDEALLLCGRWAINRPASPSSN